jgi:hypothetical protein
MATAGDRKTPPEQLTDLLREDRAAGYTFESVWLEDVECACRSASDRSSWRTALLGTRSAWEASWHNMPGPRSQVTPDLTDDSGDSRPAPPPIS